MFQDVSHLIHHTHHEDPFDDFARQPLLPRKLSQLGPGVGWYDVDGDGREDLIIGSGCGGRLAVYRNAGQAGFKRWNLSPVEKLVTRDQTTVLGTESGFLVGSANYEDGLNNGGCVRIYDVQREASGESVLGQQFSAGQLAQSLASYEAAYACRPAPALLQKAFVVACNLRDVARAKSYWKRLSPQLRSSALGVCVRNGIDETGLNAP